MDFMEQDVESQDIEMSASSPQVMEADSLAVEDAENSVTDVSSTFQGQTDVAPDEPTSSSRISEENQSSGSSVVSGDGTVEGAEQQAEVGSSVFQDMSQDEMPVGNEDTELPTEQHPSERGSSPDNPSALQGTDVVDSGSSSAETLLECNIQSELDTETGTETIEPVYQTSEVGSSISQISLVRDNQNTQEEVSPSLAGCSSHQAFTAPNSNNLDVAEAADVVSAETYPANNVESDLVTERRIEGTDQPAFQNSEVGSSVTQGRESTGIVSGNLDSQSSPERNSSDEAIVNDNSNNVPEEAGSRESEMGPDEDVAEGNIQSEAAVELQNEVLQSASETRAADVTVSGDLDTESSSLQCTSNYAESGPNSGSVPFEAETNEVSRPVGAIHPSDFSDSREDAEPSNGSGDAGLGEAVVFNQGSEADVSTVGHSSETAFATVEDEIGTSDIQNEERAGAEQVVTTLEEDSEIGTSDFAYDAQEDEAGPSASNYEEGLVRSVDDDEAGGFHRDNSEIGTTETSYNPDLHETEELAKQEEGEPDSAFEENNAAVEDNEIGTSEPAYESEPIAEGAPESEPEIGTSEPSFQQHPIPPAEEQRMEQAEGSDDLPEERDDLQSQADADPEEDSSNNQELDLASYGSDQQLGVVGSSSMEASSVHQERQVSTASEVDSTTEAPTEESENQENSTADSTNVYIVDGSSMSLDPVGQSEALSSFPAAEEAAMLVEMAPLSTDGVESYVNSHTQVCYVGVPGDGQEGIISDAQAAELLMRVSEPRSLTLQEVSSSSVPYVQVQLAQTAEGITHLVEVPVSALGYLPSTLVYSANSAAGSSGAELTWVVETPSTSAGEHSAGTGSQENKFSDIVSASIEAIGFPETSSAGAAVLSQADQILMVDSNLNTSGFSAAAGEPNFEFDESSNSSLNLPSERLATHRPKRESIFSRINRLLRGSAAANSEGPNESADKAARPVRDIQEADKTVRLEASPSSQQQTKSRASSALISSQSVSFPSIYTSVSVTKPDANVQTTPTTYFMPRGVTKRKNPQLKLLKSNPLDPTSIDAIPAPPEETQIKLEMNTSEAAEDLPEQEDDFTRTVLQRSAAKKRQQSSRVYHEIAQHRRGEDAAPSAVTEVTLKLEEPTLTKRARLSFPPEVYTEIENSSNTYMTEVRTPRLTYSSPRNRFVTAVKKQPLQSGDSNKVPPAADDTSPKGTSPQAGDDDKPRRVPRIIRKPSIDAARPMIKTTVEELKSTSSPQKGEDGVAEAVTSEGESPRKDLNSSSPVKEGEKSTAKTAASTQRTVRTYSTKTPAQTVTLPPLKGEAVEEEKEVEENNIRFKVIRTYDRKIPFARNSRPRKKVNFLDISDEEDEEDEEEVDDLEKFSEALAEEEHELREKEKQKQMQNDHTSPLHRGRGRGRGRGRVRAVASERETTQAATTPPTPGRGRPRGRPRGSKASPRAPAPKVSKTSLTDKEEEEQDGDGEQEERELEKEESSDSDFLSYHDDENDDDYTPASKRGRRSDSRRGRRGRRRSSKPAAEEEENYEEDGDEEVQDEEEEEDGETEMRIPGVSSKPCPKCQERFTTREGFMDHIISHTDGVDCMLCDWRCSSHEKRKLSAFSLHFMDAHKSAIPSA